MDRHGYVYIMASETGRFILAAPTIFHSVYGNISKGQRTPLLENVVARHWFGISDLRISTMQGGAKFK
jgi:hypothetical protein